MFQDEEDAIDPLQPRPQAQEANPFSFQQFLAEEGVDESPVQETDDPETANPFSFKRFLAKEKPSPPLLARATKDDSDSSLEDSDDDDDASDIENSRSTAFQKPVSQGSEPLTSPKGNTSLAGRIREKVKRLEQELLASQTENKELKVKYKTTLTKLKDQNAGLADRLKQAEAKQAKLQQQLAVKESREKDETLQLEQVAAQVESNLAKALARASRAEERIQQLERELVAARQQLSNVASDAVAAACDQLEQLSQDAEQQLKLMLSKTSTLRNVANTFKRLGRLDDAR
eukprot:m.17168 g.17168  ORF g.17168 m.17168 type:complete len:288 (+) comp10659_c0_seq1:57-920(+)